MKSKKKILIALLAALLFCGVVGGIALVVRRVNAQVVKVIPVESIITMDYSMDSGFDSSYDSSGNTLSVSGQVVDHVSQKVQLDNDAIISEVYVKTGDKVKIGDKLMSYDTTLTQMELEIAKLTQEENENKLARAKARLQSLENGGSVEEDDTEIDSGDTDSDSSDNDSSEPSDDLTYRQPVRSGSMVSVSNFRALTATSEAAQTAEEQTDSSQQEDEAQVGESPAETPTVDEGTTGDSTEVTIPSENDSDMILYSVLDYDSKPYAGTGTAKDPYRFICDVNEEYIIVTGSFFNKMAGYDADGKNKISEDAPFWYRIEFLKDNEIPENLEDFDQDPDKYLVGYTVKKGGTEPMDPAEERHFVVGQYVIRGDDTEVLTPTPTEEPPEDEVEDEYDPDFDSGEDDGSGSISREDAIKNQKSSVANLELQIKTGKLNIEKLEKKVANETVLATINGEVKSVGDPLTGEYDGDAFIVVESDEGVYVQGAVSELTLDQIQVGDSITVRGYESGTTCEAMIREISQFPSDSGSSDYYGVGNPNVSYYNFTAEVIDKDAGLVNEEGVQISIVKSSTTSEGLAVDAAFVRMDGGESYVYIDDKGKLKKQIVDATRNSDGYSVMVTSGLSREDYIAFPYGKSVVEGAKTEQSTLDALYGY